MNKIVNKIITQTYLSQKPLYSAIYFVWGIMMALLLSLVLGSTGYGWLRDLSATREQVSSGDQWRLLSLVFMHQDFEHLGSNLILLIPFFFALLSYFRWYHVMGLAAVSTLIFNFITLSKLPLNVHLLGISGLSYWAASTWLVVFVLIDKQKTLRKRIAISIFIAATLLIPHEYNSSISYLNHFLGFVTGLLSGVVLFTLYREEIKKAEISVDEEIEDIQDVEGNEEIKEFKKAEAMEKIEEKGPIFDSTDIS